MKGPGPISMIALTMMISITLAATIPADVDGATIFIDDDSVDYSPEEPSHEDLINVTTTLLFIDCDPVSVTLKYSLCTESYCSLDVPVDMTRVGNSSMWVAQIGPFEREDASGDPFIDVRFFVVAQGASTDGDDDPNEKSDTLTVYFRDTANPDNGNDKPERSPVGWEILAAPLLVAAALVLLSRGRRASLR